MKQLVLLYVLIGICCSGLSSYAQESFRRDHSDELYKGAVSQAKSGNNRQAINLLTNLLQSKPAYVDAQVMLARLYLKTTAYKESISMAEKAISQSPDYQEVYSYIINDYLKINQPEQALQYAQSAVARFPGDRDLQLKKLSILDQLHLFPQADKLAESLYLRYYNAPEIKKIYIYHYQVEGDYFLSVNSTALAQMNYNKGLMADPLNTDLLSSMVKIDARSNNYDASLSRINSGLINNSHSYTLLIHKLGILQEMKRYAEALDVLNKILIYYPGDEKANRLSTSLREEAAAFYNNTDSQHIYQYILDKNPTNALALNKVIGLSMAHNSHQQAFYYINLALKTEPNNTDLLGKRMDLEESDKMYAEAAGTAWRLYHLPHKSEFKARLIQMKNTSGRFYLGQQLADMAVLEFDDALSVEPTNSTALNGKISGLLQLNQRAQAIQVINGALKFYPGNKKLLLLKSSILADSGDPEAAALISSTLRLEMPRNKKINYMFIDQQLAAAKLNIDAEFYAEAKRYVENVLQVDPQNKIALNDMISLLSAMPDYEHALVYAELALKAYPDDKDFLLKETTALANVGRYKESAETAEVLYNRYQYSTKYKNVYTDGLMSYGRALEKASQPDNAVKVYIRLLTVKPGDSAASLYAVRILLAENQYARALEIANQSLLYHSGNESLLALKIEILEGQQKPRQAAMLSDTLQRLYPKRKNMDQADELNGKNFRNQFGLALLHTNFDALNTARFNAPSYNIATVEYRHFFTGGSFAGRLNFAGRQQGTGLQAEGEVYLKHSTTLYSFASAAISDNIVLPKIRLAYSIYKTFQPELEVELGLRYLEVSNFKSYSAVASVAKAFGDFWLNLRGYAIRESVDYYGALNLTTRYYLNEHKDFLMVSGAVGTSPDDRSRLIQFPQLVGLLSRSVGAGYQKTFNYRTTVSLNGTYINEKVSTSGFQNQYDLYITLLRKF